MTKDVLVSISGMHEEIVAVTPEVEEDENEAIEVVTPATYYLKNGKHYIVYEEVVEGTSGVIKNRIKIQAPDGSDITRQCTITAGENKYVIETGKNLSYDESIKVSYQVKLKEASLSGKTLKNTATGKADFVKPVSAVRLVKIKKESKSTVTTGNKADRSNTSEYKRSPGTGDAASTPKTGDSFDEKWIFALLAAALGGSFIYWKKKKKHQ